MTALLNLDNYHSGITEHAELHLIIVNANR